MSQADSRLAYRVLDKPKLAAITSSWYGWSRQVRLRLPQGLDAAVSTSIKKLFEVDHTLIVICWWNESHELHQCCRPRRYSQTRIQFQFIFTFVFRVIDNTWNWVQRVRCLWFWLAVSPIATEPSFFVFVHIITVSVVNCKTEDTTSFSISALRLFLCQQLFKSSLTFFIDFNLYYAIF